MKNKILIICCVICLSFVVISQPKVVKAEDAVSGVISQNFDDVHIWGESMSFQEYPIMLVKLENVNLRYSFNSSNNLYKLISFGGDLSLTLQTDQGGVTNYYFDLYYNVADLNYEIYVSMVDVLHFAYSLVSIYESDQDQVTLNINIDLYIQHAMEEESFYEDTMASFEYVYDDIANSSNINYFSSLYYITRPSAVIADKALDWQTQQNSQTIHNQAYNEGYNKGNQDGYKEGSANGYNKGYQDGLATADNDLTMLFTGIADTPFIILYSLLGFELFGFNVFDILMGLLTLLILIWLIRKFGSQ